MRERESASYCVEDLRCCQPRNRRGRRDVIGLATLACEQAYSSYSYSSRPLFTASLAKLVISLESCTDLCKALISEKTAPALA